MRFCIPSVSQICYPFRILIYPFRIRIYPFRILTKRQEIKYVGARVWRRFIHITERQQGGRGRGRWARLKGAIPHVENGATDSGNTGAPQISMLFVISVMFATVLLGEESVEYT